ncbi:MAG: antibiotic biosynthesis monooxygenase family protein [Methanobacterium sp.]
MVYEITEVKMQDYEKWKTGLFDKIFPILKSNGAKCRRLFRDVDNPNKVIILIEWDNLENAKRLAADKDLRTRFQKGGIIDIDIRHFEEIENKKL